MREADDSEMLFACKRYTAHDVYRVSLLHVVSLTFVFIYYTTQFTVIQHLIYGNENLGFIWLIMRQYQLKYMLDYIIKLYMFIFKYITCNHSLRTNSAILMTLY